MTLDPRDVFVQLVPLDARSRRAVDEVIADWRHEAHRASASGACLGVHIRFAAATLGALILIAARQIGEPRAATVASAVAAWIAVPYLALGAAGLVALDLRSNAGLLMTLAQLLGFGTLFLPPALFLSVYVRRDRYSPALGLALGALIAVFLLVGWIQPALNQTFREAAHAARGGTGLVIRGLAELSLSELVWRSLDAGTWDTWSMLKVASTRLSLALACPAAVLLTAHLVGRYRRRWVVALAVPLAYVILVWAAFSGTWSPLVELIQPWLLPLVPGVAAVALAARTPERLQRTG